ncbi:PTS system cellobiose/arbutin/salicin-specific transporter subunits IIBC [Cedecea neteri]|uniref:PTS system cellobiose/arbutin/salicin-specific transporter subunits IIBC n=1 Tax=Cedecea neteri TaxID=158822 RepID=A0A2X3IFS1_9ENTR|nr:PTS system cellobiose/arbutin/salicin-specific transporter subunits IIBC [Cedecea neteri]
MGVPVTAVKYTYTVIPALVMTWLLSYIEQWIDRITPAVTKNFLKPDADRAGFRADCDFADWAFRDLDRQRDFLRWCIPCMVIWAGFPSPSWGLSGRCW